MSIAMDSITHSASNGNSRQSAPDSLSSLDPFADNPLQRRLEELNPVTFRPFLNHVCVLPQGHKHNHRPVLKHTQEHNSALRQEAPDRPLLHMGVGGLFNFDIVAAGRHDAMLLCDINPLQVSAMKEVVQILADSQTPAHFISRMEKKNRDFLPYAPRTVFLARLCEMPWLKDDASFQHLHALARNKKIFVSQLDIYETDQCRKIKEWMDEAGYTPSTIYTSNILEIPLRSGLKNPKEDINIEKLNSLTYEDQQSALYKPEIPGSYQPAVPSDFAARFHKNLDILSSEQTLSFVLAEYFAVTPRIVIHGKGAASSSRALTPSSPSSEKER